MATTTRFSPVGIGILPGQVKPALFEIDAETREVKVLARFVDMEALERFAAYEPRVNERLIKGVE